MTQQEQTGATCFEARDAPGLRALCNPERIYVVRRLIELGEADIAEGPPQHRSVISRHLSYLKTSGGCAVRRDGRRAVYRLDGPEIIHSVSRLLEAAKALTAICCPPVTEKEDKP